MIKFIQIVLSILITSLYFFPFPTTLLPTVNTKTIMGGVGLMLFVIEYSKRKTGTIGKNFIILILASFAVSLITWISCIYNDTNDLALGTYFISATVWCTAAYCAVWLLKVINKKLTFELLCDLLIAAGVIQCLLALIINRFPETKPFFASIFANFYGLDAFADGRFYGIGCAFDTGGIRLAAILIIVAVRLAQTLKEVSNRENIYRCIGYTIAFIIITILGNIISRTTTVGIALAIPCFWIYWKRGQSIWSIPNSKITFLLLLILIAGILLTRHLYNHNALLHDDLRYGFEGFFSLAETGHWNVHSNNMLRQHWEILPNNTKTWIIGDGLIGPTTDDPYYVGPMYDGFYKYVDAGYLRYIFYFGLIGLFVFSTFIVISAIMCSRKLKGHSTMFTLFLILNFIIWIKVATDCFFIFSLFLMLTLLIDNNNNQQQSSVQIDHA